MQREQTQGENTALKNPTQTDGIIWVLNAAQHFQLQVANTEHALNVQMMRSTQRDNAIPAKDRQPQCSNSLRPIFIHCS